MISPLASLATRETGRASSKLLGDSVTTVSRVGAPRPIAGLLLLSAASGFALGVLFPAWHVAIEPSQVLAGLVHYPEGNPFALYETRLWTGWHQVLTPLLAAGVPERTLTLLLSGLIAALAFAALTAFAHGFGADDRLAFATPFVLGVLNPTSWEFWYPILLLGHGHTYGMAGLSWLALACGVLATGRWSIAAFLIGLGPAVHASLGAWLGLLALLGGLAGFRDLRPQIPAILRGGLLGTAITALSLGAHLYGQQPGPSIDAATATRYLDAFVLLWDAHRIPGDVTGFGGLIVFVGVTLAIALLRCARGQIGAGAAVALRIYIACGLLGIALALVQRTVPEELLPNTLLIAMPARLLNLPAFAYVPLVIGVLSRYRSDWVARALLVLLVGATALRPLFALGALYTLPFVGIAAIGVIARHAERSGAVRIAVAAMLVFAGLRATRTGVPLGFYDSAAIAAFAALAILLFFASRERTLLQPVAERLRARPLLLAVPLWLGLAGVAFLSVSTGVRGFDVRLARLRDQSTDRVLAAASRRTGLLLVAPTLSTPQLITRRPVLLDPGALDMLPYALAGAPAVERSLRIGYGVEFFNPPLASLHYASLPAEFVRPIWQARTAAQWHDVAAALGVTDVLVPAGWKLHGVPQIEHDGAYALYQIAATVRRAPSRSRPRCPRDRARAWRRRGARPRAGSRSAAPTRRPRPATSPRSRCARRPDRAALRPPRTPAACRGPRRRRRAPRARRSSRTSSRARPDRARAG